MTSVPPDEQPEAGEDDHGEVALQHVVVAVSIPTLCRRCYIVIFRISKPVIPTFGGHGSSASEPIRAGIRGVTTSICRRGRGPRAQPRRRASGAGSRGSAERPRSASGTRSASRRSLVVVQVLLGGRAAAARPRGRRRRCTTSTACCRCSSRSSPRARAPGSADRELEGLDFEALPRDRQRALALAIVRRETGIMAVSALVIFFLALRAAGTSSALLALRRSSAAVGAAVEDQRGAARQPRARARVPVSDHVVAAVVARSRSSQATQSDGAVERSGTPSRSVHATPSHFSACGALVAKARGQRPRRRRRAR